MAAYDETPNRPATCPMPSRHSSETRDQFAVPSSALVFQNPSTACVLIPPHLRKTPAHHPCDWDPARFHLVGSVPFLLLPSLSYSGHVASGWILMTLLPRARYLVVYEYTCKRTLNDYGSIKCPEGILVSSPDTASTVNLSKS